MTIPKGSQNSQQVFSVTCGNSSPKGRESQGRTESSAPTEIYMNKRSPAVRLNAGRRGFCMRQGSFPVSGDQVRRFLLRTSVTEPNRDALSRTIHRPMLLVSPVVPDSTGVAGVTEGCV